MTCCREVDNFMGFVGVFVVFVLITVLSGGIGYLRKEYVERKTRQKTFHKS